MENASFQVYIANITLIMGINNIKTPNNLFGFSVIVHTEIT